MNVVIMHQTITNHDAIGNDIERMFNILNRHGSCKCFATNRFNDQLDYMGIEELDAFLRNPSNLVIYHHSVFWEEGEVLLHKCRAKLIIRYHNITPPVFFESHNQFHYQQCKRGREQTERFVKDFPDAFWLLTSDYNGLDVAGAINKEVCAPFHKMDIWGDGTPDEEILKSLIHGREINLLFVGRVAPNKGHLLLIDILRCYCHNYGNNIKLRIIGKFDEGLVSYNQELLNRIKEYGLQDRIEFIGEITDSTLLSYYLGSDIFLCTSEHEGFCVPIIEAQRFHLPIIARYSSAIPETIGNGQVVLREDVREYASAIHLIAENSAYSSFLSEKGYENYESRFSYKKLEEQFLDILESIYA